MDFETVLVNIRDGVGIITLNRPKAMNALNLQLTSELGQAVDALEANAEVRCILLTGGDQVFAAGADIKEMKEHNFASCTHWTSLM